MHTLGTFLCWVEFSSGKKTQHTTLCSLPVSDIIARIAEEVNCRYQIASAF